MSGRGPARARQEARLVGGWTHPIGTAVRYRRDDGSTLRTKTRSEAELLGSHTAVIWLEGVSGCVALQRVTPEHLIDNTEAPPTSPTPGPVTATESEAKMWADLLIEEQRARGAAHRVTARAELYLYAGLPLGRVLNALQVDRAEWDRRVSALRAWEGENREAARRSAPSGDRS